MTISAGFTNEQIRELVHGYDAAPYGRKEVWLTERGLSRGQMRRWRGAVFAGDLDRGLVPRESEAMNIPGYQRAAVARARDLERAAQKAELAKLQARIEELEAANGSLEKVNDALGKAIGLLHEMSAQEPAAPGTTTDPSGS